MNGEQQASSAGQANRIGPFKSFEDCERSQKSATVPTSGCYAVGTAFFYNVYPSSSGTGAGGGDDDSLRARLEEVGRRFDVLPDLLASSNRILDEHDLAGISETLDGIREQEGKRPPDDLYEELKKLAKKLERLRSGEVFERKFPWRRQISLDHLISILVEILDVLRKLYGRSVPRGGPST